MKHYAHYGHTEFVLALGWLGVQIRRFFLDYHALTSDFTIELGKPNSVEFFSHHDEEHWTVSCIDTGREALTGTRVKRAVRAVDAATVMVTYGDGIGSVDLDALVAHHRRQGRLATVTAVRPPGRFGELVIAGDGSVREFAEKPQTSAGSINGGFMVFEREAIDEFIPEEDVMLEREPLNALAEAGQLTAYEHDGFWQPMDTPRERDLLEKLWLAGDAPWTLL